ncbi:Ankyrin repeat-containing protein [Wickerhamomyces ciferrii]|uniref:Ankyrin repeat-containing protein n=1 Tax=Wickerhamomyces ciferrii (strain ATCC 14091 / BCRC 22168 / CBS 111 / JCM 3599 / NBRC 0793 / NRRL Y-1031 F-60-10) TaxID=1206466 RepID=K0KMM0_WICCF|nr:Ankyrin repeat-containing protein [Wickerhamomyces ciferrii]CCH42358.1 Ankyrin repeat-containing protein [Wickerhamomyces ciferrii]
MSGKVQYGPEETFVYNLSDKLLDSLQLMYFDSSTTQEVLPQKLTTEALSKHDEQSSKEVSPGPRPVKDKEYYKSDLHRFNLKRDMKGLPRLTEEQFEELAGDLDESISGSDSSDTETDEEDELYESKKDKIDTLFEKNVQQLQDLKLQESDSIVSHLATRSPYILFRSSLLKEDQLFGIYKSLFSLKQLESPLEALKEWKSSKPRKSALLMIGGGHFAGAIINHQPKSTKGNAVKPGENILEQSVDLVVNKSFHRYTTRRKQGGSQSASDNAHGKANSAGSSLRRANEIALQNEVRLLLQSWKKELDECESIFIRANGSSNRNIIIGYENAVLQNNDERLRSFPFTTKRATTSELKKAWVNLTYLNLTERPKIDDKKLKQKQQQEQIEQSKIQKLKETKAKSPQEIHTTELISFLKKSRGPVLITYLKKNKLDFNFTLEPKNEYFTTPTLLHFASSHGIKNLIPILIKTAKADPTIQNSNGKTPYDLSANKQTRQAFQITRYEIGEDKGIDWELAHVGKAISREEVEKLESEEKLKEESDKQNLIKEELAKKEEILEQNKKNGVSKQLGGVSMNQVNINSLSDDQRMRLMREQRARAAEARFKQQQK